MFYKYGGKQLYYNNTNDGSGEIEDIKLSPGEQDQESCDSCKI